MKPYLIILGIFFFSSPASAKTITGKVVKVYDGDTITILQDTTQYKIRLANIDCPELKQPWGRKAKTALSHMIAGKSVTVRYDKQDRYKRYIGTIFLETQEINTKLVEAGHCWVYTRYNQDKSLPVLQEQAKKKKLGLWSLPQNEIMPPWKWRKNKQ